MVRRGSFPYIGRPLAKEIVRAVLEAIREPDEEMTAEMQACCWAQGKSCDPSEAAERFQSVIDHLLKEPSA